MLLKCNKKPPVTAVCSDMVFMVYSFVLRFGVVPRGTAGSTWNKGIVTVYRRLSLPQVRSAVLPAVWQLAGRR